jgi:excinuclease ABC subunit A
MQLGRLKVSNLIICGARVANLKKLRNFGNTVIVIEHDPDVMQAADHIIEICPGSGRHG